MMLLLSATIEAMGEGEVRSQTEYSTWPKNVYFSIQNDYSKEIIMNYCKLLFTGRSVAICIHVKIAHISVPVARTRCLFISFRTCKGRTLLKSVQHSAGTKVIFPSLVCMFYSILIIHRELTFQAMTIVFNATINNNSVISWRLTIYLST